MLSEYKFQLDQKIDEFLQSLPQQEIYDPIKHIVGLGGKRFRSSVLLLITDSKFNLLRNKSKFELSNFILTKSIIVQHVPLVCQKALLI